MLRTSLFVLCFFGFAYGIEWPSFVRKCRLDEFQKCAFGAANEVVPIILQGSPEYGIPNFFPYKLDPIHINEKDLKISLQNCELYGLDTLRVTFLDFSEPVTTIKFTVDTLSLVGDLDKESSIFESILPRGGVANFTIINGKFGMVIQYVPRKDSEGTKFLTTESGKVDIEPERTRYTFSEIKSGTPYLSVENSDPLNKFVIPKFKDALYRGFLDTATKLTDVFPLHAFFILDPKN